MARKKKKVIQEDPPPAGAPEWVVTFTDMISLLVTFFVLLMTYSSLDPNTVLLVRSLLDSNTGVLSGRPGDTVPDLTSDTTVSNQDLLRGARSAHSRPPESLSENLAEMGQEASEDHREIDFSQSPDGVVIQFDMRSSFQPGSAELPAYLRKSLGELGKVLEHYSYLIVVEGHTDDHFRETPTYPTAELLSMARARNAAKHMLESSKLQSMLVQVSGLGADRPRATNTTPEGRQLNRRVQLRVIALSKVRAGALESYRENQRVNDQ